jgi:putative transposase
MRRRHQQLDFAGSAHFVTTVTRERGSWFVADATCAEILSLFEQYRAWYAVECFGYVLMPDHLHVLLRQSNDGPFVPDLLASFKGETSKSLWIPGLSPKSLWRAHYDDVPIPGADAAMTRLEYMHANPVRSSLVATDAEYRWSSAPFYHGAESPCEVSLTRP